MGFDLSRPLKITDENLSGVRAWLAGSWRGRRSKAFVLDTKRCPVCASFLIARRYARWNRDESGGRISHSIGNEVTCPWCQRLTVEDPWVPDNESPAMAARPHRPGWVRCPNCGVYFSLAAPSSWAGGRHRRCGQQLDVVAAD